MLHKVHGSIWDGGRECVRAIEGKVVPSIASPVIVGHEKAFINLAENLRLDDLPVGRLKGVRDFRGEQWGTWRTAQRAVHVGDGTCKAAGRRW